MSSGSKVPTPVLDRMRENQAASQTIGEFLAWLDLNGMFVARYLDPKAHTLKAWPINDSIEQLLARYFDVDLQAAENERAAIIEAARRAA